MTCGHLLDMYRNVAVCPLVTQASCAAAKLALSLQADRSLLPEPEAAAPSAVTVAGDIEAGRGARAVLRSIPAGEPRRVSSLSSRCSPCDARPDTFSSAQRS